MTETRQAIDNLELVERALVGPTRGADLVEVFGDDQRWDELRETFLQGYTEDCQFAWIVFGQRDRERSGPDGLRSGWLDWLQPWKEYRLDVDEVRAVGDDQVLVFVRMVGVPREGAAIEMRAASLVKIRDGRICSVDFHAKPEEAIAAAGGAG
jgi:SnoaL-like domain